MRIEEMLPFRCQYLTEFACIPHKYWIRYGRLLTRTRLMILYPVYFGSFSTISCIHIPEFPGILLFLQQKCDQNATGYNAKQLNLFLHLQYGVLILQPPQV